MHSFPFFHSLLTLSKEMCVGIGRNEKRQTYIQTLEQVIINHSRAKCVNSSDTNGSAASPAHTTGEKNFHWCLILPDSLA